MKYCEGCNERDHEIRDLKQDLVEHTKVIKGKELFISKLERKLSSSENKDLKEKVLADVDLESTTEADEARADAELNKMDGD